MSDLILTETVTDSVESVETVLVESSQVEIIESVSVELITDSIVDLEVVETITSEVIETETITVEIIEVAQQGPRGIQGIPGPAGGLAYQLIAGMPLSGHRAVQAINGFAAYCDGNDATHAGTCIGISLNAAAMGDAVNVQAFGEVIEPSWAFSDGSLFVQGGGQIGLSPGLAFSQEIGRVINSTTLFLNVQPAILKG